MTFPNKTSQEKPHLYNKLSHHPANNQSNIDHHNTNFSRTSPLTAYNHELGPYGSNSHRQTVIPSVSTSSARDTFFVFLTLFFISLTLYFTFFLWRKHRQRPLATLYKLEEYRYSRLSQNEMEVDSVVFYGDAVPAETSQNSDDEDGGKPATLQVETGSLITLSNNCKSISGNGLLNTAAKIQSRSHQENNNVQSRPIIQDSDEDLLQ